MKLMLVERQPEAPHAYVAWDANDRLIRDGFELQPQSHISLRAALDIDDLAACLRPTSDSGCARATTQWAHGAQVLYIERQFVVVHRDIYN